MNFDGFNIAEQRLIIMYNIYYRKVLVYKSRLLCLCWDFVDNLRPNKSDGLRSVYFEQLLVGTLTSCSMAFLSWDFIDVLEETGRILVSLQKGLSFYIVHIDFHEFEINDLLCSC